MIHKSLITNDPATVLMNWDFDGAELDLLSKALFGVKRVIDVEDVQTFIQGVVEALITSQLKTEEDNRAYMVQSLKANGKDDNYINSYLRGWDMVSQHLKESKEITNEG